VAKTVVDNMETLIRYSACRKTTEPAVLLPHTVNCMSIRFCFSALCDFVFWFVNRISQERLNGFAPNSQGRRVWSLARMSLNVKSKVKVTRDEKRAVHSHHPRQRRNGLVCCMQRVTMHCQWGGLRAFYVWKNIFALVYGQSCMFCIMLRRKVW